MGFHALANLFGGQSSAEKNCQEHSGFHCAEVASEHSAHLLEIMPAAGRVGRGDPTLRRAGCDRDVSAAHDSATNGFYHREGGVAASERFQNDASASGLNRIVDEPPIGAHAGFHTLVSIAVT
jgi:hypothetical protein